VSAASLAGCSGATDEDLASVASVDTQAEAWTEAASGTFDSRRLALVTRNPRLGAIPYESERGFAATLHTVQDGLRTAVKGAGERVLPMCTRMATDEGDVPIDTARVEAAATLLASDGYRVLAVAERRAELASSHDSGIDEGHLRDLTLLGLVGMIDPLRPEANACVEACQRAGIGVAMVTGDPRSRRWPSRGSSASAPPTNVS